MTNQLNGTAAGSFNDDSASNAPKLASITSKDVGATMPGGQRPPALERSNVADVAANLVDRIQRMQEAVKATA